MLSPVWEEKSSFRDYGDTASMSGLERVLGHDILTRMFVEAAPRRPCDGGLAL